MSLSGKLGHGAGGLLSMAPWAALEGPQECVLSQTGTLMILILDVAKTLNPNKQEIFILSLGSFAEGARCLEEKRRWEIFEDLSNRR